MRPLLIGCLILYTSISSAGIRQDISCLTEAIYFEARSESVAGQLAVGLVIKNRVEHPTRWGDSYCEVVHEPYQFSYYNDGLPEIYYGHKAKLKAWELAERIYFNEITIDFTEGSLYYHTQRVSPRWDYSKIERVLQIDNHIFYKDQ